MSILTPEHFTPYVDRTFSVRGDHHRLILTEVGVARSSAGPGLRQPFNLIFRGPPGDVLPEGLYTLNVEDGPAFELYVIPVHTPMPGLQNYQSAFN